MKKKLLHIVTAVTLLLIPQINFAQAPDLGTSVNFVLFSSNGALTNTGITHLTGNVGTNNGSSTGFGNVDGVMHDMDLVSASCATDLLSAYNDLNATIPTFFPAPLLGNGQSLNAGVYSISSTATLNDTLFLNGQGNPNAVFIIQIIGAFSTNAGSQVRLINNAQACNVFWKVEGLVSMATGTTMRGTVIANNAAIDMSTGVTLEGRALSTTGSVTVDGIKAYMPIGCGSVLLTGPTAPALASTACYAIFSANGPVTNTGVSYVTGDIGTNSGLTTGFNSLNVNGMIHPIPDASTVACAADLLNVYTYLNTLPYDIELLYPAQFGNNLVLTPHTYLMNGAITFIDTVFLNAQGNPDAVFVLQLNGALATSTYSNVMLINGAQAKNVFWKVDGAVDINNYSNFSGTIVVNNAAINLSTISTIKGSAFTTNGAITTTDINSSVLPNSPSIIPSGPTSFCDGDSVMLVASNSTSYDWSSGDTTQNIMVYANGTYYVAVVNACGIKDTSMTVIVTENPLPMISVDSTADTVCLDDFPVTLIAVPSGGVWTGAGVSGSSFNPTIAGVGIQTLTYTYSDVNGCSDSANVFILVNGCLNLNEIIFGTNVVVYPNPNDGSFTINVNSAIGDLSIQVIEMQGRVLFSSLEKNVQAGFIKQIILNDVADGMYMLRLSTKNEVKSQRISVKK